MEKWHTRLLREIVRRGWSKAEFARRAGLPKERVYKYLRGDVKRPPDEKVIEALAGAVGWTPTKLMYGTESPGASAAMPHDEPPSMRRTLPIIDWGDVSMHTQPRANGAKSKASGSVERRMPIPDNDVSAQAFYLEAPDDSSAPDIRKGDLLICDPALPTIPGHYYVAEIAGHNEPLIAQYTVTRWNKRTPAAVALVYGDEAAYGRHEVPASQVRIIGRITHRTSKMPPVARKPASR